MRIVIPKSNNPGLIFPRSSAGPVGVGVAGAEGTEGPGELEENRPKGEAVWISWTNSCDGQNIKLPGCGSAFSRPSTRNWRAMQCVMRLRRANLSISNRERANLSLIL